MTDLPEVKVGYIRARSDVRLLDSSAVPVRDDPRHGFLDLLTDDGCLRLAISHGVAEDLMIDLQQFLKSKTPTNDT